MYVIVRSAEQWLQFDIGPPTLVTGVVTKGRGDGRKRHWVTEYRLSYSNDSRLWHFYKDEPLQDIKARLLSVILNSYCSCLQSLKVDAVCASPWSVVLRAGRCAFW